MGWGITGTLLSGLIVYGGIGWLIDRWIGALFGVGLSAVLAIVLDGLSVREIRVLPDGVIEFRALWRRTRVAGSRITRVTGFLDEDEGIRSYNLAVSGRRREIQIEEFPAFPALLNEIQRLNPGLELTGEVPLVGESRVMNADT